MEISRGSTEIKNMGLDNVYRLVNLFGKEIGEARTKLEKLKSDLDRRRNYARICDLLEDDRNEGPEGNF
jgi:hypothetical protein